MVNPQGFVRAQASRTREGIEAIPDVFLLMYWSWKKGINVVVCLKKQKCGRKLLMDSHLSYYSCMNGKSQQIYEETSKHLRSIPVIIVFACSSRLFRTKSITKIVTAASSKNPKSAMNHDCVMMF